MSKYKIPSVQEMLEAGVHFGHQVRRWNPGMEQYIYTVSKNIHIIDLEDTERQLKAACDMLFEVAKKGGRIVFVGTKKQARDIISSEAKRAGAMYVNERWVGGTVTNFRNIRRTLDKYLDMIKGRADGRFETNTKKERLLIDREIEKFLTFYGGIANMKEAPAAIFVVDPKREKTAVREATGYKIPVVALIDTNGDPKEVTLAIPGNDDAIRSIALVAKVIADAVEEGYKEFAKASVKPEAPVVAAKAAETKTAETKSPEIKSAEPKISEPKATEHKPAHVAAATEAKSVEAKKETKAKTEKAIKDTKKK